MQTWVKQKCLEAGDEVRAQGQIRDAVDAGGPGGGEAAVREWVPVTTRSGSGRGAGGGGQEVQGVLGLV